MVDRQMLIRRTLRVPRSAGPGGDGAGVARQLDAVLAGVGFKAARDLLAHLSALEHAAAMDLAVDVVGAVRELVGDHVQHNAYFINFPHGVPDTVEFWVRCLRDALLPGTGGRLVPAAVAAAAEPSDSELRTAVATGWVNLLELPTYGRYPHTYAELLAAHDELIPSVKDRVTIVHLGGTLEQETHRLYLDLAASTTPLGEADLALLAELAQSCHDQQQPADIPVRENRAVINAARLAAGLPLLDIDTVVDVLRLAAQVSGGDPTLVEPTRFHSLTRRQRRALLAALDAVVADNRGKLGDVNRHARMWKRLGEGLHPHEYPQYGHAQDVFAVARGERTARSLAGRAELAFAAGELGRAAAVLSAAPGMLARSLDRLLRQATDTEADAVLAAVEPALAWVSGRVLCSLREHLLNRGTPDPARVFTTRGRRAWVTPDTRPPLPTDLIDRVAALLDAELTGRLPVHERLVVDPAVLDVALPLSGKANQDGFAVLPRGSRARIDGEILRFFTYWRQTRDRTDFDLSALLLDDDFRDAGHVSWTRYHNDGMVYSGDITDAPDGATEFIDVQLHTVAARCIVPQVNIYSGEGFDQVAESMFGWMLRDRDQHGAPFEARTVRTRSDMRGTGHVCLPIAFLRGPDGSWEARWLHLYLTGYPHFNRIETNQVSTSLLTRAIIQRQYLTIGHLVNLMAPKTRWTATWDPTIRFTDPVTFVGLHAPDGLPAGSTVITLDRLNQLIPE